jgi:hypothetical protein
MIFVLILSVVLCALAAVMQFYWENRKFYRLYNKLPLALPHLPLIGCGHKFFMADSRKLFKMAKLVTAPGPSPRRMSCGPMCFVVVDDAEQFQKVYSSKNCTDKIFFYKKFLLKSGKYEGKVVKT